MGDWVDGVWGRVSCPLAHSLGLRDQGSLVSVADAASSLGDLCGDPVPSPVPGARLYPVSRAFARGSLGSLACDPATGGAGSLGAAPPVPYPLSAARCILYLGRSHEVGVVWQACWYQG